MGLKTMVLAGTTLATMTLGFTAPAFAAAAPFAPSGHPAAAVQLPGGNGGDDDVSGLLDESPVCSALGAETIPSDDVVAQCLVGTKLV